MVNRNSRRGCPRCRRSLALLAAILATTLVLVCGERTRALLAGEAPPSSSAVEPDVPPDGHGGPPEVPPDDRGGPPDTLPPSSSGTEPDAATERGRGGPGAFPPGMEWDGAESEGYMPPGGKGEPAPRPDRGQPRRGGPAAVPRDEIGTSLPWEPTGRPSGDWRDRVRRRPAPIPPGRPLPYYPPEPPPTAPDSSTVQGPPDFVGSAAGYLEIPVGQTATLFARDCRSATLRDARVATVVAREPGRVLVRGLFPGRTLLDVDHDQGRMTYIVQVR